jgi:hypothetical protein
VLAVPSVMTPHYDHLAGLHDHLSMPRPAGEIMHDGLITVCTGAKPSCGM